MLPRSPTLYRHHESASLGIGIGMAYVPTEFARINEEIEIDIRGRRFPATIQKKPLHKK